MSDVEHTYIQTEGISSALLDAKSQVNILKQTQDIVNQLKTTTTTTTAG